MADTPILIPTGTLTLTAFAPIALASFDTPIVIPAGELVLSGFAPVVVVSEHGIVKPGVASLRLRGFAPVVTPYFPDVAPLYEPRKGVDSKVNRIAFQEGLSQRVPRGITGPDAQWALSFKKPRATIDTIETFLESRDGAEAFFWTPPGETTMVLVTAPTWSINRGNKLDTLSTTFVREYDVT